MPQQQGPQSAGPMANQQSPGQYGGQQGGYGGPPQQSPAGYGGQPMGYGGPAPASAGGYGRGQPPPNAQWPQPASQPFGNGFQGYQG
jgi:nucleolysin TIA-1/TIAR